MSEKLAPERVSTVDKLRNQIADLEAHVRDLKNEVAQYKAQAQATAGSGVVEDDDLILAVYWKPKGWNPAPVNLHDGRVCEYRTIPETGLMHITLPREAALRMLTMGTGPRYHLYGPFTLNEVETTVQAGVRNIPRTYRRHEATHRDGEITFSPVESEEQ